MTFGMGRLAWPPQRFWTATPRELAAAMRAFRPSGHAAPERAAFEALIAAFPDG